MQSLTKNSPYFPLKLVILQLSSLLHSADRMNVLAKVTELRTLFGIPPW